MISGTPKFDSLAVYELSATVKPMPALKCKLGFTNTRTGDTHGWSTADGNVWSSTTLEAFARLVEAMEKDLGDLHLQVADGPTRANPMNAKAGLQLGGLGEHVGGDKTPQL